MNILDIFIAASFIVFAWIGFRRGILRTILSIVGLFVGGAFSVYATPSIKALLENTPFSFIPSFGLASIILGASLGMFLFGILGGFLRVILLPFPILKILDSLIGLALALITVITVIWTFTSAATIIPNKTLNNAIKSSKIIYEIDKYLPDSTKGIANKIQETISKSPLQNVFKSLVESRIAPVDIVSDIALSDEVKKSIASTVRIDGIAPSCSAAMTGTGFVVSNEHVLTNAHVVAGMEEPVISISGTNIQLGGKIVAMDRKVDIAVIYVPGLNAKPLTFIGPPTTKEIGFVTGYPNGGSLTTTTVSIASEFEAIGTDIDGKGEVIREVIVFGGKISPGNSGGPLFNQQGQVLGLVFAADATNDQTGYALAPDELTQFVSDASNKFNEISSGECAQAR